MSAAAPLSAPTHEPFEKPPRPQRRAPERPAPQRGEHQRRELVKTTAGVRPVPAQGPQLHLVPKRKRAVGLAVTGFVFLFALLLGATAFQTQIARNQLQIDATEKGVRNARERYDNLRRQRAELRSPNRLAVVAAELGMVPAENGEFLTIDGSIAARIVTLADDLPSATSKSSVDAFAQFSQIKSVAGDAP